MPNAAAPIADVLFNGNRPKQNKSTNHDANRH
jgi:hypothetical protein